MDMIRIGIAKSSTSGGRLGSRKQEGIDMKDMSSSHSRQQHICPPQHLELFTSPSSPSHRVCRRGEEEKIPNLVSWLRVE